MHFHRNDPSSLGSALAAALGWISRALLGPGHLQGWGCQKNSIRSFHPPHKFPVFQEMQIQFKVFLDFFSPSTQGIVLII